MPRLTRKLPAYRHHKASGQAVLSLNGQDVYLGRYGTDESKAAYDRTVAEWLAMQRRGGSAIPTQARVGSPYAPVGLTVDELFLRYWAFSTDYYRKDGKPTTELGLVRLACQPLIRLYGRTGASSLGPLQLKAIREKFITRGLSRRVVNKYVGIIKRMFKWAAENELVPADVYHGLQAVSGLRRGRSEARETDPISPVPDDHVAAALPFMSRQVAAMVKLQRLTGMRPGEVTQMRACDVDTSGTLWAYRPQSHKTEHHGRTRVIYLGPKAQELLKPWLNRDLAAYLFSPAEAEEGRRKQQRLRRRSPLTPSQRKRRPKRTPLNPPRKCYTNGSYRRAIHRACDQAFPLPEHLRKRKVRRRTGLRFESDAEWRQRLGETNWAELKVWQHEHRWSPNQLRHNAATFLRKEFGIEAARVVLGHSSAAVTEVYAELDQMKAADIMAQVG